MNPHAHSHSPSHGPELCYFLQVLITDVRWYDMKLWVGLTQLKLAVNLCTTPDLSCIETHSPNLFHKHGGFTTRIGVGRYHWYHHPVATRVVVAERKQLLASYLQ